LRRLKIGSNQKDLLDSVRML